MLIVDKVFRTERAMRKAITHTLDACKSLDILFTFNRPKMVIETQKERMFFYIAPNLDKAYYRAGLEVDRVDIFEPLPADVCAYLNSRIKPRAFV